MRREPDAFIHDHYQRTASRYDSLIAVPERLLFRDGRQWATGQANGEVLEIAAGTGRNFAHYPAGVRVRAVDLSSAMAKIAEGRAGQADAQIEVAVADAQALPFPDASFDTVVATLALCSIPDDQVAVREMSRVLRPGGVLVLLEHVRSPSSVIRAMQRLLQPAFLRLEGDHLLRQPEVGVQAAGLHIDLLERSKLGIVLRLLAHKHL